MEGGGVCEAVGHRTGEEVARARQKNGVTDVSSLDPKRL